MLKHKKTFVLTLGLLTVLTIGVSAQFGTILKGAGISFIVSKFGPEINKVINAVTKTPNNDPVFASKVVPIISVGDGKEAGAVQIMGPRDAVGKVQAVAQFESNFKPLNMRLRGLVPMDSKDIRNVHRVPGVGISGLLDVKI